MSSITPRQLLDNQQASEARVRYARRRLTKALADIHDEMIRKSPGEPTMSVLEWIDVLILMLEQMTQRGLAQEHQLEAEPYIAPAELPPRKIEYPLGAVAEVIASSPRRNP